MTHGASENGLRLISASRAAVAGGEDDGHAQVGHGLGDDRDRVARVELAERVAPRVVDDVDAPQVGLVEHVVVGGHDGGGEQDLADREADQLASGATPRRLPSRIGACCRRR